MMITLEEAIEHIQEEMSRPENEGCQEEVRDWAIQDLINNGCDPEIVELIQEFI